MKKNKMSYKGFQAKRFSSKWLLGALILIIPKVVLAQKSSPPTTIAIPQHIFENQKPFELSTKSEMSNIDFKWNSPSKLYNRVKTFGSSETLRSKIGGLSLAYSSSTLATWMNVNFRLYSEMGYTPFSSVHQNTTLLAYEFSTALGTTFEHNDLKWKRGLARFHAGVFAEQWIKPETRMSKNQSGLKISPLVALELRQEILQSSGPQGSFDFVVSFGQKSSNRFAQLGFGSTF